MKIFQPKYRWILHLIFWGLYSIIQIVSFGQVLSFEDTLIRFIPNLILHSAFAYLNYYYLIPRFFLEKKYLHYFGFAVLTLLVFSFIRAKIDEFFPPVSAYFTRKDEFFRLKFIIPLIINLLIWVLSSLLRLLEDYFENVKRENELRKNRLETELKFLKSQINPHFLFNTLNNVYSLVYLKSDDAAPMMLKLSGILRYMLYDSDTEKVTIQREINYLRDCIELQILNPKDRPKVSFEVENQYPELQIEPLLFINFLENSFKHSSLSQKDGFIKIKLRFDAQSLNFEISNSTLPNDTSKDTVGGIGLQNIKQRLELVYPNRHELKVEHRQNCFYINLKLIFENDQ